MAEIRSATEDDIAQIEEVIAARLGPEDAVEARIVLEDPAFDRRRWSVAIEDGRVRSTMASFQHELRVGHARIPTTAIEFVASEEGYERRGLIRRQFAMHHDLAVEHSEIIQYIVGIPYFYRRLGYEYTIPYPGYLDIATGLEAPAGIETRPAEERDLADVVRLQNRTASAADVAITALPLSWEWYLRSPAYRVDVAIRGGEIVGSTRSYSDDERVSVLDAAADRTDSLAALLAGLDAGDRPVSVLRRPGLDELLEGLGSPRRSRDAYYVRSTDPVLLLVALRSVLEQRLRAAEAPAATTFISRYIDAVEITYDGKDITSIRSAPGEQAPVSQGGSGAPPESFLSMVLGPESVDELDQRDPAFNPGEQRQLLHALFPPLTHDIHAWVPI